MPAIWLNLWLFPFASCKLIPLPACSPAWHTYWLNPLPWPKPAHIWCLCACSSYASCDRLQALRADCSWAIGVGRLLGNCFTPYDDTSLNPIVWRKNTFWLERGFLFMCVFAGIKASPVCWPSIFCDPKWQHGKAPTEFIFWTGYRSFIFQNSMALELVVKHRGLSVTLLQADSVNWGCTVIKTDRFRQ